MPIDVAKVERSFQWEDFKDGKPYLGTYRQEMKGRVKMHTMKLDLENWIKIDSSYASQQREKERLLETLDHSLVFVSNKDDSTELAKSELLKMIVDYLPNRYPDKFERREGGIYNKMLEEFVSASDDKSLDDPLLRAARLTQEDWCIMEWSDEHEAYCLTAGALFFPMRWSLQQKWNLPMMGIHQPVDGFVNHLAKRVADVFKTMSPDSPIYRGNWALFNDLEGPLDLYTPSGHEQRNSEQSGVSPYKGAATGTELTFRAEYQTLRKLPQSKAIVFSIRTFQFYLEDFKKFPRKDTEQLVVAIENIHPEFVAYKSASFWREAGLEYLKTDVLGDDAATTTTSTTKASKSATATLQKKEEKGKGFSYSYPIGQTVKALTALSIGALSIYIIARMRKSS